MTITLIEKQLIGAIAREVHIRPTVVVRISHSDPHPEAVRDQARSIRNIDEPPSLGLFIQPMPDLPHHGSVGVATPKIDKQNV